MSIVLPASEFGSGTGLFENVPDERYFPYDAFSASKAKLVLRSPAHAALGFGDPSPAMAKGSALHLAMQDLDLYKTTYGVFDGDRRTKAGKALWEELVNTYGERNIVRAGDAAAVVAAREAVLAHPVAAPYATADGFNELTAVWEHERTGLLCKSRLDRVLPESRVIVDYKTTSSAEPRDFWYSIKKFAYYRQAAFYMEAIRRLAWTPSAFIIIAVEMEPPYGVSVHQISEDALAAGWQEIEFAVDAYLEARDTGIWRGYEERIHEFTFGVV